MRVPSASGLACLLVSCLSGCTGVVQSPDEPTPIAVGPGAAPTSPTSPPAASPGAPPATPLDDGRVFLRRLNRLEYNNTVRDLLETKLRPADRFAPDEVSAGFDTVGESLALSPLRLEQFESAADQLVDELLALPATDPRRTRLMPCNPAQPPCARQVLEPLARRAFRRPLEPAEVDRLARLADRVGLMTSAAEEGLRAGLKAILLSPNFLFHVERARPGSSSGVRSIDDHELASRLSYFLWASLPDAVLLGAASARKLTTDPNEIPRQVGRMLDDPRARALTEGFASQWLTLRRLPLVEPDPKAYPSYDLALRTAAEQETSYFFEALVREDRPLLELLLAEYSFVNDRLARHYGLKGGGPAFVKTALSETGRLGLLTQASVLMETSHPARTSPVKRGVWVLDQILCSPPPPAPPNVEALPPSRSAGATLREQLEQHRQDPACAGCHRVMDPIGFGLEAFDGIGRLRSSDNGQPIDSSGTLLGGGAFKNASELIQLLARDPRVPVCLTQQLLTYAVGRPFSDSDGRAYVEALAANVTADGVERATFRRFITAVATSEALRTRRN